ncbi:unnamed protein product [Cuscuta epithymum]|uniref:Uncharacterized protein n=1 Tax=Cuscuta epithymum TaxID=186058 RepID=A0AAV0CVV4_9ASTE|nr:unnamed protein product [Cuscuta epithymum]
MEGSQETDHYIRESAEQSSGLPVPRSTLELKLQCSEQALLALRAQYLCLRSKLNEKDQIIERARAESCMNATAMKKFVEENQRLAKECSNLLSQCKKLERECSLYENDREALMDFGNEADQRAKTAENRIRELEIEVENLSEDLQFHNRHLAQKEAQMKVDTCREDDDCREEQSLVDSLLETIGVKVEHPSARTLTFLESNSSLDSSFQTLLTSRDSRLRPSTRSVVVLAAEALALRKDKEYLLNNLLRAEDEVKVIFEENNILEKANKKLTIKLHLKEGNISSKGNKRKSSPLKRCPIELDDVDLLSRQPLSSPLREN